MKKFLIFWELPECDPEDMKWAKAVGKWHQWMCSTWGSHRPSVCKKKKKKNAVSAKRSKAEHNKIRFACIGYNWTLCFYICVVYLFDVWFPYSVVSSKRMGMCSAYLLCPSTSRIIVDIMCSINICFFYF